MREPAPLSAPSPAARPATRQPCFAARALCSFGAVAAFAGTLVSGTWLLTQVMPSLLP